MMKLIFVILLIQVYLAFITEAEMFSWGVNDYGQLGFNSSAKRLPTTVSAYKNLNIINVITSGTYHIAITSNGEVYVAGNDWYGCLGLGNDGLDFIANPIENEILQNCKVFAGKRHVNALCGNKLYGWGVRAGYVRGLSSGIYSSPLESLTKYGFTSDNVKDIMAGAYMSFITMQNGTIFVAGYNGHGVLGLGDTVDRYSFVKFTFFDTVPLLSISQSHAGHICAISQSYSLYCWGDNTLGQLGIGTTADKSLPTIVDFFEREHFVVQVAVGLQHTIALTASGLVFAWGYAENGALGNNIKENKTFPTPIEITSLSDKHIVEIVAGLNFNFARTADNKWYSWGAGSGGVLGSNSDFDIPIPTLVKTFEGYNINRIKTASTSRSVYGWFDPAAPTIITGPPLVNECEAGTFVCSGANAECKDTDRSAKCVCKSGYLGDGQTCFDIDECTLAYCVSGATCANSEGSYTCSCPTGTVGDGKKSGTGCTVVGAATGGAGNGATGNGATGGATTGNGNSGTTGGGSATTGNGNGGSGNGATSGNGNGGSGNGATSGNGASGGATTRNGNSGSTTWGLGQYQTLRGAHELDHEVEAPVGTSTTGGNNLNNGVSAEEDRDRDVMIAVLVIFGIIVIAAIVAVGVIYYKSRK